MLICIQVPGYGYNCTPGTQLKYFSQSVCIRTPGTGYVPTPRMGLFPGAYVRVRNFDSISQSVRNTTCTNFVGSSTNLQIQVQFFTNSSTNFVGSSTNCTELNNLSRSVRTTVVFRGFSACVTKHFMGVLLSFGLCYEFLFD